MVETVFEHQPTLPGEHANPSPQTRPLKTSGLPGLSIVNVAEPLGGGEGGSGEPPPPDGVKVAPHALDVDMVTVTVVALPVGQPTPLHPENTYPVSADALSVNTVFWASVFTHQPVLPEEQAMPSPVTRPPA